MIRAVNMKHYLIKKKGAPPMRKTFPSAKTVVFILIFLNILFCCSIQLLAQTGPLNPGFENGSPGQTPSQWFSPTASAQGGYSASLTDENPQSGKMCVIIKREREAGQNAFGNLMQSFSATPFRSKRIRFRAAVRTEVTDFNSRAQLWLRVDRPNMQMGFFDNMGDRPISSSQWKYFDIIGDIDPDAESINIGLMLIGNGKAWLDDVSFEIVGAVPKLITEPARPLTRHGLENLIAFSRLLGYVRHFHPSDEAAQTDWEAFAIQGMRVVENAAGPSELANKLGTLFRPIAPTVKVFLTSKAKQSFPTTAPLKPEGELKVTMWNHLGFGTGNSQSAYRSQRITADAPGGVFPEAFRLFREAHLANLGGGVSCAVPLALFADATGTLPHSTQSQQSASPPSTAKSNYSAKDRATRLADVALAWNVFQHFYPYFDLVKTDWPSALATALTSAATDQNELEFLNTLRRMVAALHDGHGRVSLTSQSTGGFLPPITWDWIENSLMVTEARDSSIGIVPGDVVLSINKKPVAELLAETESFISGATSQWIRYRALQELALGDNGQTLELEIEPFANIGTRRTVLLKRSAQMGTIQESRPSKIKEIESGIFYIDLNQIEDRDFSDALPKLSNAKGIVFDMRGYPRLGNPMTFFSHLSEKAMTSAQWHIPSVTTPDHKDMKFQRGGDWQISPAAPYLKARKAFITNGRAISYAESCMGIVEHYKLGEIVGGPTAGTNGNVNPFTLPGGYSVMWTGMKVLKQDGSQHHGVGILPTIPASRTRAGVGAGRDELLERAIQSVKQ
jgi:C-terminal processing protease CtpA/Prc